MLRIATWNVNSVRLRLPLVERLIAERAPDVLCLQEIKAQAHQFPAEALRALGYAHQAINGRKGYHGVATISRRPFEDVDMRAFCGQDDGRHVAVRLGDLTLHNIYLPAGGDVPDPDENDKFAHKLDFLDELADWLGAEGRPAREMVVGDLNVAPLEQDVWSHKALLKVVSHTPIEVEKLNRARAARGFVDASRHFVADAEKLYSWWSYRARDWSASDRGRRLDHVWVTPALKAALRGQEILRDARGWERPSDHAPVIVDLDV